MTTSNNQRIWPEGSERRAMRSATPKPSCQRVFLFLFSGALTMVSVIGVAPPAIAATVTAEGTITAVDTTNRTISVSRRTSSGQKVGTFKVSEDARVVLGGRAAVFESLRAGQQVSVTYDTDLAMVTGIDAQAAALQLIDVQRIWDCGEHNGFGDLAYFKGGWFCALPRGTASCLHGWLCAGSPLVGWRFLAIDGDDQEQGARLP